MEEIVEKDELKQLLEEKKHPVAYWGLAPTGKCHIGYFVPALKAIDLVRSGMKLKILIADLHAHLDDEKSPFELLDARSEFYMECLKGIFESIGLKNIEFVKGTDFQLDKNNVLETLRFAADVTFSRCKRAASEVVRFGETPKLGGFVYPLLQIQDIVALKADVTLSGLDQRGIYMLGREILPKFGHKKPVLLFTPLLVGLSGDKMSGSEEASKISLIDSEDEIKRKINNAFCPAKEKEGNAVLRFLELIVMPFYNLKEKEFVIERPEKYGGNVSFENYKDLEKEFLNGVIHPQDLKNSTANALVEMLSPIRKRIEKKKDLIEKAYPE